MSLAFLSAYILLIQKANTKNAWHMKRKACKRDLQTKHQNKRRNDLQLKILQLGGWNENETPQEHVKRLRTVRDSSQKRKEIQKLNSLPEECRKGEWGEISLCGVVKLKYHLCGYAMHGSWWPFLCIQYGRKHKRRFCCGQKLWNWKLKIIFFQVFTFI